MIFALTLAAGAMRKAERQEDNVRDCHRMHGQDMVKSQEAEDLAIDMLSSPSASCFLGVLPLTTRTARISAGGRSLAEFDEPSTLNTGTLENPL